MHRQGVLIATNSAVGSRELAPIMYTTRMCEWCVCPYLDNECHTCILVVVVDNLHQLREVP